MGGCGAPPHPPRHALVRDHVCDQLALTAAFCVHEVQVHVVGASAAIVEPETVLLVGPLLDWPLIFKTRTLSFVFRYPR